MLNSKSTPLPPERQADEARRADIAAKVREQFTTPADRLLFGYAYEAGRLDVQVQQLRDALIRYGRHANFCRVTEALNAGQPVDRAICSCGLDQAISGRLVQ
ncbi:MAG TPA: hypothetical protein VK573_12265 [Gemmatimonadales bacterium]|nr:hypothetical protein [Gemmatimonadales bacterium]